MMPSIFPKTILVQQDEKTFINEESGWVCGHKTAHRLLNKGQAILVMLSGDTVEERTIYRKKEDPRDVIKQMFFGA